MLKFTVILHLLILIYIGPISKLIILFLYSTSSPKIITNGYRCSFSLYSIPNHFTVLGIIWFLITPLSTIALNCLLRYLTPKSKCLLIVPLRV